MNPLFHYQAVACGKVQRSRGMDEGYHVKRFGQGGSSRRGNSGEAFNDVQISKGSTFEQSEP